MLYTVSHFEDHFINIWNVLLPSHIINVIVDYIVNSLFLLFNSSYLYDNIKWNI